MFSLKAKDEQDLLRIAYETIEFGLKHGEQLRINAQQYSSTLQKLNASFTTLKVDGKLRGCTGTTDANLPLVSAVSRSAYTSAFCDLRFQPILVSELAQIKISISILSQIETLSFTSEKNLIEKIRPGIDGLILSYNDHKGTLLPVVWKSIPNKHQFFSVLKEKAGLPQEFWSSDFQVSRYTTHIIE